VRIFELIELLAQRINEKQKIKYYVDQFILLKPFHSTKAINLIIILAIVLRVMIGLGSYSGEADHPHYGDFEAHRNWMSITLNRNMRNWYEEIGEEPWWRIDYPPVAAYLSYIFGKIYQSIEPDAMRIQRGY
jgi:alpha-1,3-glucosyltransferase